MHAKRHLICGIHITDRLQHAVKVQELLTQYGKFIKTRLGLHEVGEGNDSPNGLLLLEFLDDEAAFTKFTGEIATVEGIEVQKMIFDHP